MKIVACSILFLLFSACCLTGNKCDDNYTRIHFQIVDLKNRTDLVFGPSRIYKADSIRFFSVRGTDTMYHFYKPPLRSYLGTDSFLLVDIDVENNAPVLCV